VFIGLGLTLTMSRSAILGIVVSSLIIFFILRRKRVYQILFVMIVIAILFLVYPPLNELISLLFRIEEGFSARDYLWAMSINMIKDNPIFGIGPGAYNYELFNYYPFMLNNFYGQLFIYFSEVAGGVNLAHNMFLVFFVDMGILGFITSISLPVVYFRIGIKTIKKFKNQNGYYLIIGLFAAGASIIFRNIFNSIGLLYVGGIQTDLPFWLIFSSLVYFYKLPSNLSPSNID
jgi:putative inorganic carbon (HCO3(-)) transporter